MIKIDAIGDVCPLPVIKTKKALQELVAGQVEVLVDNEIAVQNIQKYANSAGCRFAVETQENYFRILIEKPESAPCGDLEQYEQAAVTKTVVVLSSNAMGSGVDELGRILMKGFVFALTQLDVLPETILLYNAGAKLAVSGAVTLEDLIALEKAGVKILTCGTCLNYFNIADQLGVGEITNMYSIVEEMRQATRILRP